PDLAVVQWWHPWFAPMLAWLLGALPARGFARERLAVVCHNVLPHQPVPLQRTLARSVLRRAGHVVVHARSEAERVLALVPRARVHCVPMPCLAPEAPAPSREAARARLGLDARPWVLCFGLVRAYKGLDDLLVATAATPDDAFRVLIAGEFYVREAPLRARARALGIEDRVRIENRFFADREVPDLFAAADLVVLPYRRATQSAVLPLAVRYRRKLVVTDAGGLAEAAPEVARVVPAASPGALAAALVEALAAPAPDEGAFAAAEARQHPAGLRRAFAAIAAESRGSTAEPSPVLASVVVCTQGTEPLLRDCLVALCDQELPDGVRHEVVVVAGTEPAAIRAMLGEGFDCAGVDVRIVHEPERGLNHKRNRGV